MNRRQAIALGLSVMGLGDQGLLRIADRNIDRKVRQAEAIESHSPAIPPTYSEDLRRTLHEDIFYKERTTVDMTALLASSGILFIDKYFPKKNSSDSQED